MSSMQRGTMSDLICYIIGIVLIYIHLITEIEQAQCLLNSE